MSVKVPTTTATNNNKEDFTSTFDIKAYIEERRSTVDFKKRKQNDLNIIKQCRGSIDEDYKNETARRSTIISQTKGTPNDANEMTMKQLQGGHAETFTVLDKLLTKCMIENVAIGNVCFNGYKIKAPKTYAKYAQTAKDFMTVMQDNDPHYAGDFSGAEK